MTIYRQRHIQVNALALYVCVWKLCLISLMYLCVIRSVGWCSINSKEIIMLKCQCFWHWHSRHPLSCRPVTCLTDTLCAFVENLRMFMFLHCGHQKNIKLFHCPYTVRIVHHISNYNDLMDFTVFSRTTRSVLRPSVSMRKTATKKKV